MTVIWSQSATAALVEIHEFIARDSTLYAQRMVDRLTHRSRQLATFPDSGAIVPEFSRDDIREVLEGPYRIIYQRSAEQIAVVAIIHGARQLTDIPIDR